jgi:acetyl-CoA C-acetyltransferase
MLNSIAFEELGISNVVCVRVGDASGAAVIKEAANSILAGQSKIVMVLGVEKLTDLKTNEMLASSSSLISQEESFIGATVQSQFALITRKYLHKFKLKSRDLSFIPAMNHKNALDNEYAQYQFELSEEKINSSPLSADPIRMLECASYCDGCAALIMCDEETARKKFANINKRYLLASSLKNDFLSLSKRKSIVTIESSMKAAQEAYKAARIKPGVIDIMEIHDIVPISEILAIEDLGFAKKGEGIKFIKANYKKINCSGGLKGCGHAIGATGIRQAISVIDKLKESNMKYGLTHTLGGTGSVSVVNVFCSG